MYFCDEIENGFLYRVYRMRIKNEFQNFAIQLLLKKSWDQSILIYFFRTFLYAIIVIGNIDAFGVTWVL